MRYYLWLLPSAPEAIRLQQIITDLCRGYSQDSFLPHLTLWSGACTMSQALRWVKQQKSAPIQLTLHPTTFGDDFFQCIYIPMEENQSIRELHDNACASLARTEGFHPHISLLYGHHSISRKRDISTSLHIPFSSITFTELALIEGHSDPSKWKVLFRTSLSSSGSNR